MPAQGESREQLMTAILQRSQSDAGFRRALLQDPGPAIERAFGVRIPPEYRLRFIERDPDVDALIVLPDRRLDEELTDADLESVAGGVVNDYTWAPPPTS